MVEKGKVKKEKEKPGCSKRMAIQVQPGLQNELLQVRLMHPCLQIKRKRGAGCVFSSLSSTCLPHMWSQVQSPVQKKKICRSQLFQGNFQLKFNHLRNIWAFLVVMFMQLDGAHLLNTLKCNLWSKGPMGDGDFWKRLRREVYIDAGVGGCGGGIHDDTQLFGNKECANLGGTGNPAEAFPSSIERQRWVLSSLRNIQST